jgi:hypothetical protein
MLLIGTLFSPSLIPKSESQTVVISPPICQFGYFPDWPYDCAPYGYYDPSWFQGGIFIGAGPWFQYNIHPRGYYSNWYHDHPWHDHSGHVRTDPGKMRSGPMAGPGGHEAGHGARHGNHR